MTEMNEKVSLPISDAPMSTSPYCTAVSLCIPIFINLVACLLQKIDFIGTMFTLEPERLSFMDIVEPFIVTEVNTLHMRPGVTPNIAGFIMAFSPLVSNGGASQASAPPLAGVHLGLKQTGG